MSDAEHLETLERMRKRFVDSVEYWEGEASALPKTDILWTVVRNHRNDAASIAWAIERLKGSGG